MQVHKSNSYVKYVSFPFDLDPMTLILKFDLNMVKKYLCAENEVPIYSGSKVIAWTGRHRDRQTHTQIDRTEIITYPHTWKVKI